MYISSSSAGHLRGEIQDGKKGWQTMINLVYLTLFFFIFFTFGSDDTRAPRCIDERVHADVARGPIYILGRYIYRNIIIYVICIYISLVQHKVFGDQVVYRRLYIYYIYIFMYMYVDVTSAFTMYIQSDSPSSRPFSLAQLFKI